MRTWQRAVASACAVVAVVLTSAPTLETARAQDGSEREWNQARGNAQRTGLTILEPVHAAPEIAWTAKLSGPVVGEPVTWGGTVYVAAKSDDGVMLHGFQARTGDAMEARRITRGDWADLATWQGRVIACSEDTLQGFPVDDGAFGMPWKKKGDFYGAPLIYAGRIFVRDGGEIVMFDARTGRKLTDMEWHVGEKKTRPDLEDVVPIPALAVRETSGKPELIGAFVSPKDKDSVDNKFLYLHASQLEDPTGRKPKFGGIVTQEIMKLGRPLDMATARGGSVGFLQDGRRESYIVSVPGIEMDQWAALLLTDPDDPRKREASNIRTVPALCGDKMYGFGADNTFFAVDSRRKERPLGERKVLPAGAKPGPAVASGEIVCFGNWAMDVANGNMIWCVPDLADAVAVTPIADGFMAVATVDNELVCLAEPDRIVRGGEGGASSAVGSEVAPPPPAAGDGVFLRDGRKVLGAFAMTGDTVRITPKEGEPFELPVDEVVLAEKDGAVEIDGEEPAALAAWQNILDGVFTRTLIEAFDRYENERLLTDARRVLIDARSFGIGSSLAEEMEGRLAGQRENPNVEQKKKRLGPLEDTGRAAALEEVWRAVEWCRERELEGAATALLDYAVRENVDEGKVLGLAGELVPDEFPWRDETNAAQQWLDWARAIVPAGARFTTSRVRSAPWTEETLAFQTRNVVFLSRTDDIKIVGMCLRVCEGTVRALEATLGKGSRASRQSLDVRLHRSREDYLAESTPSGGALPWSAGYYSPGERVSRFFVSKPGTTAEPLGRDLSKTLAHELTHQWLSERWLPSGASGRGSSVPGYFVVEGFARYVEDQSVEMGRRAGKMDDTTVSSLDAASQVAKLDKLQHTKELIGMTQADFAKIPEKRVAVVNLRNSLGGRVLDTRALFYEQSGSVVFWLMTQCGDEGREALVTFMRSHYMGSAPKDPSQRFGFKDGEELHAKFQEFLLSLLE